MTLIDACLAVIGRCGPYAAAFTTAVGIAAVVNAVRIRNAADRRGRPSS